MSIEAMKQALEALSCSDDFLFDYHDCEPNNEQEQQRYDVARIGNRRAIESLRQAIEQAEKQEPVAWWCCIPGQDAVLLFDEPRDEQYPPGYKEPLYTSPPPRQPLTDEQRKGITAMWSKRHRNYTVGDIIDAVEAAHGIKGEA
jgi:hypothetical protein